MKLIVICSVWSKFPKILAARASTTLVIYDLRQPWRQGKRGGQTRRSLNYYSTTQLYYFGNCCFRKGSSLRIHYRNNDGWSGCQHFYQLFCSNWIGTRLHWQTKKSICSRESFCILMCVMCSLSGIFC